MSRIKSGPQWLANRLKDYFGARDAPTQPGRFARVGLGFSGGFLVLASLLILWVDPHTPSSIGFAAALGIFGSFNLLSCLWRSPALSRTNQLAFAGHITATIALYLIVSRFFYVGYTTDTVVATYMGVLRALQLQSPYGISIKPLMDQFGFSPSFYTPGVDGSFDFHLAYPSLSFLTILPFYIMGLHDIRDTIFLFNLISIIVIFGLAPAKFKSVSLAPFGLFPVVIAGSWTDSVWAFFLILTALLWYKKPRASWVTFGLAVATKQIAILVAPFLLIRLWHEKPTHRLRNITTSVGLMLGAFFLTNLPFIFASPSAWWGDIVAPYLPNSPSQVPGGIGLSSLLLDLGIALPSSFYLILTLGASSFLLYFYARHYRGLNGMVFAFPILVFFFYYRSFPNYMVYWVFPLVLDLCRLGGPNLRHLFSLKLPSIAWHPPTESFLRLVRRRLTPSAMVLMALTFAFVGVSGAFISQASTPKMTIQIQGATDPDGIGAATQVTISLTNLLSTPVSPIFFVKWAPLPYVWTPSSTGLLNGSTAGTYTLNAPDALAAIPRGNQFHVLVYDKLTQQLLGESSGFKADIPIPTIANPGLKWWVLDETVGKQVPFGWKLALSNTDLASSKILPLGVNGTSGLHMIVNNTAVNGNMAILALSQRVPLSGAKATLTISQPQAAALTDALFAESITDGTHTLYFVFSNKTIQQTLTTYASNTTVLVPMKTSSWNTVTIDAGTVWNSQGWGSPQQVTLTLLLESDSFGVYDTSVLGLTAA